LKVYFCLVNLVWDAISNDGSAKRKGRKNTIQEFQLRYLTPAEYRD